MSAANQMARALLITYDLKTPGRIYKPFYDALKDEANWWHYLSSTWIVITEKDPQEMHTILGQHLSINDSILIVEVTVGTYWGFLAKDAWDWIEEHTGWSRS